MIAYLTLFERHLLGRRQNRIGPNKSTLIGVILPLLDGIKLLKKENLINEFSSELFLP
jgi:NADH-quinone oxidoreductase subunit H